MPPADFPFLRRGNKSRSSLGPVVKNLRVKIRAVGPDQVAGLFIEFDSFEQRRILQESIKFSFQSAVEIHLQPVRAEVTEGLW